MPGQMRKGDIGSTIRVTVKKNGVPLPLQTATLMKLKLAKPSGVVVERVMVFNTDGSDGKLKYVTLAGDLDEAGPWSGQVSFTIGSGSWHTDEFSMVIGAVLVVT